MRLTRVFVPGPLQRGGTTPLPAATADHVIRVLRLGAGDALTVFDGSGGEFSARISTATKRGVDIEVLAHRPIDRESPLAIVLLQSLARGEKMDWVIQKATELGVTHIVPVAAERSVVKLDAAQGERRRAHWQAVAIAACEQCGRNRVPDVALPQSLGAALRLPAAQALKLVFEVGDAEPQAGAAEGEVKNAAILIGPEGGLTPSELAQAHGAGFRHAALGPRILRTETAAIAAIATLQMRYGDLRAADAAATLTET
jgi:16S rRNA (uracil1498-N3)-methyltransferase